MPTQLCRLRLALQTTPTPATYLAHEARNDSVKGRTFVPNPLLSRAKGSEILWSRRSHRKWGQFLSRFTLWLHPTHSTYMLLGSLFCKYVLWYITVFACMKDELQCPKCWQHTIQTWWQVKQQTLAKHQIRWLWGLQHLSASAKNTDTVCTTHQRSWERHQPSAKWERYAAQGITGAV